MCILDPSFLVHTLHSPTLVRNSLLQVLRIDRIANDTAGVCAVWQQPLVTKIQSSLQRGWNLARGVSDSGKLTRKDKLPEVAPDIEDKILKYKEKRELSDSCNTSVCNSDAEDSVLDEGCGGPLSTSVDISSQRSRLRRRGGGGSGAGGKTDSEDESEPSLAQILAMTKNRLSSVSGRQRQGSAGEEKSSVGEDAAQNGTSQTTEVSRSPGEVHQSSAASDTSSGVEEKGDDDKARMLTCEQAAKRAPAMVAKPNSGVGDVVEKKDAGANVSPTLAYSALDPGLFVSPMPSREAPTSSASVLHTSIQEGAGKGGNAMWGGGGGGTVMFSMTPGKDVQCLDAAGAGEASSLLSPTTQSFWRSLNAQANDGGAKARDSSAVVQDEKALQEPQRAVQTSVIAGEDGGGGSGLSPTTAAFWQHSQVIIFDSTDAY